MLYAYQARNYFGATNVGSYLLFGGGSANYGKSSVVDSYDETMTRGTPTPLVPAMSSPSVGSNGKYALFAYGNYVVAYDEKLTRAIPTKLEEDVSSGAAVRAGNYILIGNGALNAYDLFLTRTTPDGLYLERSGIKTATVNEFGLFAGGYVSDYKDYETSSTTYNKTFATVDVFKYVYGGDERWQSMQTGKRSPVSADGRVPAARRVRKVSRGLRGSRGRRASKVRKAPQVPRENRGPRESRGRRGQRDRRGQGEPGPQGDPGETGPQGPPGKDGAGLPPGGTKDQVLTKASDMDGDVKWSDPSGGGVEGVTSFNGRTGDVKPQAGDYTAADIGAATMEQVNAAIQAAVLDSWEGSY